MPVDQEYIAGIKRQMKRLENEMNQKRMKILDHKRRNCQHEMHKVYAECWKCDLPAYIWRHDDPNV